MIINRLFGRLILTLLLAAIVALGLAQTPKTERPADATAKVEALDSFHTVIFKIWHDAWPKKDAAMLQKLLPDVEKGISDLAGAQLPGILREKKALWEENVKKLQTIGAAYTAAADKKDDAKLLDAAEKLHSQYEALGRIIRPALKEIDDFHSVLYQLYHYYLPANNGDKIKTSVAELKQKMVALNEAKLPARLSAKEAAFVSARDRLSESVAALDPALASNDEKKIKIAISTMHSDYEALNGIFE